MDLTWLLRISISLESKRFFNYSFNFISVVTKKRKILKPHNEMTFNSLLLRDLETIDILTCYTLWQNTKLNGRRHLVSTKEVISYHSAKMLLFLNFSFIAILFLYCKLLSRFLTSYCILRNIS